MRVRLPNFTHALIELTDLKRNLPFHKSKRLDDELCRFPTRMTTFDVPVWPNGNEFIVVIRLGSVGFGNQPLLFLSHPLLLNTSTLRFLSLDLRLTFEFVASSLFLQPSRCFSSLLT